MPFRVAASIWCHPLQLSDILGPGPGIPLIARAGPVVQRPIRAVPPAWAAGACGFHPGAARDRDARTQSPEAADDRAAPDDPPAAGHPRHRPLPGRRGEARRPCAGAEAQLEREPVRAVAAALEAYRAAAGSLHLYPPTDHAALRAAIGEVHGLDPARIICGAGSDEIIAFLTQAYAGPGLEVIHTEHGFGMYRISALAAGATPVEVRRARAPHRRRRDPRRRHRAHGARLHRQPQQPDRHDDPGGRGRAAGGRPAGADAARARRRLCRVRRRASTATPASSRRATTW